MIKIWLNFHSYVKPSLIIQKNLLIPGLGIDYGLDVSLIPQSSKDGCSSNKIYRERFGTCSCDTHCSWDLCRSLIPPSDCLLGTDSIWRWDNVKNAWVAQLLEGDTIHLHSIIFKVPLRSGYFYDSINPKVIIILEHWYDFKYVDLEVSIVVIAALAATSLAYLFIFPKMVSINGMFMGQIRRKNVYKDLRYLASCHSFNIR